jgi:hypothetical protein
MLIVSGLMFLLVLWYCVCIYQPPMYIRYGKNVDGYFVECDKEEATHAFLNRRYVSLTSKGMMEAVKKYEQSVTLRGYKISGANEQKLVDEACAEMLAIDDTPLDTSEKEIIEQMIKAGYRKP